MLRWETLLMCGPAIEQLVKWIYLAVLCVRGYFLAKLNGRLHIKLSDIFLEEDLTSWYIYRMDGDIGCSMMIRLRGRVNTLRPSGAYVRATYHHWFKHWPVACPVGAKPMLDYLVVWPLGTKFSELWIEIHIYPFTKIYLNMSSAKCRPFCHGFNVLVHWGWATHIYVSELNYHWFR